MKFLVGFLSFFILVAIGCKKEDVDNEEKFDRELMLKNYAENLIIPAYEDAIESLNALTAAINEFDDNLTESNLENAQSKWIIAFEEWQYSSVFNIGPAAEQGLSKSLNEEIATFPVSSIKIDDIINNEEYNLQDFNRDARGFLALEYLLFGGVEVNNSVVLDEFSNNSFRITYAKALLNHMITKVENVLSTWKNSFLSEFIKNNGTDAGSSTSELYNSFVLSFETIKNLKIELPLGLRPGQTQPEPQLVQAYYSGQSLAMLKKHIEAIENTYLGKSKNGSEGISFKKYLESVVGGTELVSETLAQWENVLNTLYAIPNDSAISQQITSNPQPLKDFGQELQKHTRFFKSDMSSRLGIAITYSSGDGD